MEYRIAMMERTGSAEIAVHAKARPFLKWAGGKRQLLPRILKHVPKEFGCYHEPFVGGGALFFYHVAPRKAVLYDSNTRLVRTWRAVRDEVETVIKLLEGYPYDRDFFMRFRAEDIDQKSDAEVAAWLIYLNKTAFNGLYRVNRANRYNVPFGRYSNPVICDPDNLRACSVALASADIVEGDFASVETRVAKGDFVYFDPPYHPLSTTSSFTAYSACGFGPSEQIRLRDVALRLKGKGIRVLLSNSDTPEMRRLYSRGFRKARVSASRAINSKAERRGKISELLTW